MKSNPFNKLRQFARPRAAAEERCEMCKVPLAPDHPHLLHLEDRRIVCSCTPCALLFPGRPGAKFCHIPRTAKQLPSFQMSDGQWDSLLIPIGLAFFFYHSIEQKVVALYPSPAGATESLLPLPTWEQLTQDNPVLKELEPDVEALLVNRVKDTRGYYRVGIDQCFKLVGIIRAGWRGFSGGTEVWDEIDKFFEQLR